MQKQEKQEKNKLPQCLVKVLSCKVLLGCKFLQHIQIERIVFAKILANLRLVQPVSLYIYIYIYIYMCVCVCVSV